MSGFDDPGIYYSDSFGGEPTVDEGQVRKSQLQKRFKEFLRQYRIGTDRTGFTFKYRCTFFLSTYVFLDITCNSLKSRCVPNKWPVGFMLR